MSQFTHADTWTPERQTRVGNAIAEAIDYISKATQSSEICDAIVNDLRVAQAMFHSQKWDEGVN